jgi:hypothetical protein
VGIPETSEPARECASGLSICHGLGDFDDSGKSVNFLECRYSDQKKAHILLVTINKQGKADEHKYMDHWIDGSHFHWQSQNATDPSSKRGQEIIRHAALGIDIHLFVRENKLAAGKAAPFTYHGRVVYQSHQGSQPMSVVFGLTA